MVSHLFHRHKTGSVQQIYDNIRIAERKSDIRLYINSREIDFQLKSTTVTTIMRTTALTGLVLTQCTYLSDGKNETSFDNSLFLIVYGSWFSIIAIFS